MKTCLSILLVISISLSSTCQINNFFDDFVDNKNNWDTGHDENEQSRILEGKYKIKITDESSWHWFGINLKQNTSRNYRLETSIKQINAPINTSLIGLIFNANFNMTSSVILLLDTETSSFKLIKYKDKKPSIIQDWTTSSAIRRNNKIEIVKTGHNYHFFINETFVANKMVKDFYGNSIGYYTGPLAECEIDYVKVDFGTFPTKKIQNTNLVQYDFENGWNNLYIKNQLFSSTFIADFKSKEQSSFWELVNDSNYIASSRIESERLIMEMKSKGRIGVPTTMTQMDLTNNNFDIISVFDNKSNSIYQGVLFGYEDKRNYSSITFNSDLQIMVYEKYDDGILVATETIRNIYTKKEFDNELRIKKDNEMIRVYINGIQFFETNKINHTGKAFGVIAGGDSTKNISLLKSFSVKVILSDNQTFSNKQKINIIKVKKKGGVYSVPVELNGVLKIDFIFDSGASDVSISPDVALTLIKTGTITKENWIEGAYYKFADGSIAKSKRFKLNSIKIGDKVINNVVCSISNSIDAPMLLGQSLLGKFGKYTFDNINQQLIID